MATLNQSVQFTATVDGAVRGFEAYANAVLKANSSLKEFQATQITLNKTKKGFEDTINFEGFNATGQKVKGVAKDIGQGFEIIKTTVEQADKAQKKLHESTKGYLLTLQDVVRTIEFTAVKSVFGVVTQEIKEGISEALKYQIAISEIRTISQENQLAFGQWSSEIQKVSDKLGLPIADVAAATYEALSNQVVKGANAFKFLGEAGDLARTTQATLKDSVNILSSAFNAFGIDVSETERVSAQFFKTVDLGRVHLSEMANTFGRIAFTAAPLGVTLEDVQAGIATLTVQGVKFNDAGTLLTNIFQKLLRPTDQMKDIFKELGVASGQAAIQTFGFSGVLQRLFDLARSGKVDIGDVFNEIRGRKGFEGLTNFEGQFTSALGQIKNSVEDYRKAIEIRAESPADFLIKESNKIKNVFTNEVGQRFLLFSADTIKALKEVAPSFDDIANSAKSASIFLAAYGLTVGGVTVVTNGLSIATRALNFVLARSPYFVLAAGIAVVVKELIDLNDRTIIVSANTERLRDIQESAAKNTTQKQQLSALQELDDSYKKTFSNLLNTNANATKSIVAKLSEIRDKGKEIGDVLGIGFKDYLRNLGEGVNVITSNIKKAENNIKESGSRIANFKKSIQEIIFDSSLEAADPIQKFALRFQKIEQLKNEAKVLFRPEERTGDPVADKEAEARESTNVVIAQQKLHEAAKLVSEDYKEGLALIKENAAAAAQLNVQWQIVRPNSPLRIGVNDLTGNKQLNDILALTVQLETQYGIQQRANILTAQKQKDAEKTRIEQIQQFSKEFTNFDLQDKAGGVKSELKDTGGKIDVNKALSSLGLLEDKLRGAIGSDSAAQVGLIQVIEAKKTQIVLEATQQRAEQVAKLNAKALIDFKQQQERGLNDINKEAKTRSTEVFGQGGGLDLLSGDATSISEFTKPGLTLTQSLANTQRANTVRRLKKELDQEKKELDGLIAEIKASPELVEGVAVPSLEQIQSLVIKRGKFEEKLRSLLTQFKPDLTDDEFKSSSVKSTDGKAGVTTDTIFTDFDKVIKQLFDLRSTARQQGALLDDQKKQLEAFKSAPGLVDFEKQFPNLATTAEVQGPRIELTFKGIQKSIESTTSSLVELQKSIDKLDTSKLSNFPKFDKQQTDNSFEEDISTGASFFASGGVVGKHPGAPRGTDTIPAWLTPHERVLSVEQNKAYERLMTRLQPFSGFGNGGQPRYYAEGGVVTTNVGDIHISVSGNQEQPVEQIGKQLQRLFKRRGIKT